MTLDRAFQQRFGTQGDIVKVRGGHPTGGGLHATRCVDVEVLTGPAGAGAAGTVNSPHPTNSSSPAGRWFVKTASATDPTGPDRLEAELDGLAALGGVGVLEVPGDAWVGSCDLGAFLAMRAIPSRSASGDFFVRFGRQLARHHRASAKDRCGYHRDNYLGLTEQPNGWQDSWVAFFAEQRLGFQLRLARRQRRSTPELQRLGDRLIDRLSTWLEPAEEPPCLLHGDLWSGNFLVGPQPQPQPIVIDPAVHYGHRECDLAMARLFGGFDEAFYRAYSEAWPLPAGSSERIELYQLYHRLNHLNLFGESYLAGCLATLRRFVG